MKHKTLQSTLIALFFSYCLGFATVGCLLTGYDLRADMTVLALSCLLLTMALTIIVSLKHWHWYSIGLLLAFILLVLFNDTFQQQLVSVIDVVCKLFARAYDLSAPTFRIRSRYTDHLLPLLAFHCIISYTCSYAIVKQQPALMTTVPSILFLGLCFLTLDSMPELAFLLLWLFTFMLLLLTHAVRRQDRVQGIRLTRLAALPVALCLLLTLVFVPSDGRNVPDLSQTKLDSFWDWMLGDRDGGGSGNGNGNNDDDHSLDDHVSLNDLPPRNPEGTPIMTITSDFGGTIYLRAQDFDEYTGTAWNASKDRAESDFVLPLTWLIRNGTIRIEPEQPQEFLYVPCYPDTPYTITGGMVLDSTMPDSYTFSCTSLPKNWEDKWRAGSRIPSAAVDNRYLTLPTETFLAAQDILAQLRLDTAKDVLEQVNRIHDLVHNTAKYDLQTSAMPSEEEDFAIWFLTQAETGFCVHYATAATVLLRAAGIPARYVEGYSIKAVRNAPVTVRDTQAHAWVEYYLDGAGWIILDPTNSSPDITDQPDDPTTKPTTKPTTQPTTPPTTNPTTQPTTPPTTTTTTAPTHPSTTQPSGTATTVPSTVTGPAGLGGNGGGGKAIDLRWLIWAIWVVLIITGLVVLVLGQYLLRRGHIRRKLRRGSPNDQALARYREANRLSKLSGISVPETLTFLAEKARFSQHTLTPGELAAFDTFFQDCATAIREKKPLRRFYLRIFRVAY